MASKYHNLFCTIDGIKFHSQAEAAEYSRLKLELKAGEIKDLKLQPKFQITINDIKICKVILDFIYFDKRVNKMRYIDVKGVETAISRLKKKLVEAQHGIEVELVKKKSNGKRKKRKGKRK
mgnify:CR=1 FL=1